MSAIDILQLLDMFGLLKWVAYAFLQLWATWVFYLAVMNLKRVKDTKGLHGLSKYLGYLTLPIGLFMDWLLNVVLTIPFADLPAEPKELVTGRLKRYASGSDGRRKRAALWLAKDLLDDFDPSGKHV